MLCLSALRIIFVRILFAVCVSDGGFVSETRFCFSCEVLPVCFVLVSVGLTVLL